MSAQSLLKPVSVLKWPSNILRNTPTTSSSDGSVI